MKTVLIILKKEFARFFKDTRLMLTTLILPGLLIFLMYTLIGTVINKMASEGEEEPPTACVLYMPDSQSEAFSAIFDIKKFDTPEAADEALKGGELDLVVVFPTDDAPSKIQIYYNSAKTKSQTAYYMAVSLVSNYTIVDLADEADLSRTIMSSVVPMVLMMLLFSGCMAVAPEAIAGEKERGTIATLLVTPVRRSHIAIGKIGALSVIALLSGLSSALGLILSLPRLAGEASGITLAMYGFAEYASILAVVLSSVLVMVSMISIISAFAKSVKEASGMVVPLMILVMLCGLFSMFATGAVSLGLYFIPLFNSALSISHVLAGTASAAGVAITVCVNAAVAALFVVVLALMFGNEKIMFNK